MKGGQTNGLKEFCCFVNATSGLQHQTRQQQHNRAFLPSFQTPWATITNVQLRNHHSVQRNLCLSRGNGTANTEPTERKTPLQRDGTYRRRVGESGFIRRLQLLGQMGGGSLSSRPRRRGDYRTGIGGEWAGGPTMACAAAWQPGLLVRSPTGRMRRTTTRRTPRRRGRPPIWMAKASFGVRTVVWSEG